MDRQSSITQHEEEEEERQTCCSGGVSTSLAVSISNGCVTKPPSTSYAKKRPTVTVGSSGAHAKLPSSASCRFYAVQGNNAIGL